MLGPKCNNGFITFRTSGLLHLGPNFITFRTFITFTTLFRLGGGGGRKVPAPTSTFENFLDILAIPTKCGHFY